MSWTSGLTRPRSWLRSECHRSSRWSVLLGDDPNSSADRSTIISHSEQRTSTSAIVLGKGESDPAATVGARRQAFRALHEGGCFVIPNPWDVVTDLAPAYAVVALAIREPPFPALPASVAAVWQSYRLQCAADGVMYQLAMCRAARDLGLEVHLCRRGGEPSQNAVISTAYGVGQFAN
jgi:hypothetical protein